METKTYILNCPHCGTEKKVTFSAHLLPDAFYTYWSDGRVECDGWKETIRTHQCPSCKKYYSFYPTTNIREDNEPCDENGQLSYETLKQAIAELSGDDYAESWARLEAWRAYNAIYQDTDDIPEEEQAFNRANMQWLVDFFTPRTPWFSLLVFELNRLLGKQTVCEQMLEAFTYDEFIKKTKTRDKGNGINREYDEATMRKRYITQKDDLKNALAQYGFANKPYKVS